MKVENRDMKEYFVENKIKKPPFKLEEENCILMTLEIDKEEKLNNAISEIGLYYYISNKELEEIISNKGCTREEVIKSCLPNKGNVMAGEFGEILSTELIQDEIVSDSYGILYNPFKLRWKEDRKKAALKTDVVLINLKDDIYDIYSAEVKTKANKKIEDSIYDMFDGIRKDRASRLAETLYWMKEKEIRTKYSSLDNLTLLNGLIEKFKEFNHITPIKKQFIGVLVTDKELYSEDSIKNVKAKFIANKTSVKSRLKVLEEIGVKVEVDGKTLDFTEVKIEQIQKLPEVSQKDKITKQKILDWFNNANLVMGLYEEMKVKIIAIDKLQQNYEKVFDMIK